MRRARGAGWNEHRWTGEGVGREYLERRADKRLRIIKAIRVYLCSNSMLLPKGRNIMW